MNKRVKIVATLGPAVEIRGGKKFGEDGYWGEKLDREASAKNIAQLIKEGANVFRFNFSHGDHAEQGERMDVVRMAEDLAGQKVGFLLDTKGPEIRTELFEGDAKEYAYKTGEQIRVLVLNKVLTLSLSHSYVLQKMYKKFVLSVKKLVMVTFNCWLKSKTNKVSITLMKSSKLLTVL